MVKQIARKIGRGLLDGIISPESVQEGLVPFGNFGLYATPDEPIDPRDCERYPDSPWCGGQAFDRTPIGIETAIVRDECNLGLQITGTFAFVRLPVFQIMYRAEECRHPEPQEEDLPSSNEDNYRLARDFPVIPGSQIVFAILEMKEYKYYSRNKRNYGDFKDFWSSMSSSAAITGISEIITTEDSIPDEVRVNYTYNTVRTYSEDYKAYYGVEDNSENGSETVIARKEFDGQWNPGVYRLYGSSTGGSSGIQTFQRHIYVYFGFWGAIKKEPLVADSVRSEFRRATGTIDTTYQKFLAYKLHVRFPPTLSQPPRINPFPPRNDMACDCNKIITLLTKILKSVGGDEFPASVPASLTDDSPSTVQIQSVAHFMAHVVKLLDNVTGRYPIKIKVKDADATQEGDQSVTLDLPNQAEAIAEMFGLVLQIRTETDAILSAAIRALTEAGAAKQAATIAVDYGRANAEFLGYEGKQKIRNVPFAFTPGATKLHDLLKESHQKVKGWENADKDDLSEALQPLLEMASRWNAQNYRNVGTDNTIARLKEILAAGGDLAEIILSETGISPPEPAAEGEAPSSSEFEQFLEKVENGFTITPGISDTQNPYGRDRERRPRIKEIGIVADEENAT